MATIIPQSIRVQPITIYGSLDPQIIDAINNVSMPRYAQVWGLQARLTYNRTPGAWALWMLQEADIPGDLAYHISMQGVPVMKVFADTIAQYGSNLCQDVDHEIKEALRDPSAQLIVPRPGGGNILAENCDPVANDGIDLGGGMTGANFVYPSWYDPNGQPPFDERQNCTRPGETRPGGYVEEEVNGRWTLAAMRIEDGPRAGLHNWRIGHHGRLAYAAQQRLKLAAAA